MSADFIDSNIFIYLFDEIADAKRGIAESIISSALSTGTGVVSFQIVQECTNVLSRKLAAPADDVIRFLDSILVPLWKVSPSPELYREALHTHTRYGFSFYDSMVVAAAQQAGCRRLLSEDLQHGQRVGELTVVNPFI